MSGRCRCSSPAVAERWLQFRSCPAGAAALPPHFPLRPPGRVHSNGRIAQRERREISAQARETQTEAAMESGEEAAESWYQLPAEEDASAAMPRGEHTDFPSLEEGTLLSETDGRRVFSAGQPHLVQLELQDSCLSPCLPLLTTDSSPAHKFFEDTLFQKTGVEHFAPLRAELDVSEFPGHPPQLLQMSDVVELTSKEITMDQGERSISLSQHYMRETIGDNKDVEGLQPLSASCEEREDKILSETESAVVKPTSSDNIIQPVVDNKDLRSDDGAFLSSSVPAPVLLELLEKEVGMSSSSGRSSRRSSKSSTTGGTENVHGKNLEPAPEQQNLSSLDPGAQLHLKTTSHQTLEETFIDSSEIDFFKDAEKEMENSGQLNRSGITLRHMKPQSTQPSRDALHKQLCSEIQQRRQEKVVEDAAKSGRETMGDGSPRVHVTSPSEPKVDNTAEARSRDELSMSSRCSIERGHKDTEISQTGNTPVDETSFIGRLPHPISQSTPGTFTMNLKPLSGRIQQIKAKLTGSDMSLNEDPSAESAARNSAPTAVPQSIQSSQGYPESSDSQRSLSPQRRRIQSLPSLNYIEKVGAWNTNQSFDALVLRGLTGVSPKKLAYNAVADSLNRMLSRQTSSTAAPRKELAASFKATSSMTNLSLAERESSTSTITRSQSYNSVLPGRDQNQEEAAKSKTSQSSLRGSSSIQDISSRGPAAGDLHLLTKPTSSEYQDTSHRRPEKACNTSRNQSRNFVTMDRFSDVSSDQDYASASLSSSHEKEMLVKALTSAKQDLTEGEGSHDWSPPEDTSGKEQLDIEERIPTYLRNLGIDQSPTAILTPFAPQGPIREPEFSPTELRTIKGSTATPSRSMRLSEGGSQSAVNISQSSLYSSTSTTSVSIPMGSDIGPESPLPEISPQFGFGSTADRPISQDDTMPRGVSSDLAAPAAHEEMSPAIKDLTLALEGSINEDNVELTRVKQLIDQFESGRPEEITSHDVKDASLQDYTQKLPPMDPVNDSFVGSKTLKEIQKLFAEAENIGLDRSGSSLHRVSPVGDPYTMAPTRSLNLEDSLNSRSATPLDLLVKDMSWDSSFNSSFTRDPSVTKDSSVTSLPSSSVRDQSYLGELIKNRNTLAVPLTDWGRSEPEGSCKATSEKMMPSTSVIKRRDLVDVAEKMERSQQLLSSVSSSVGDLRNALAFTGTGYIRGRETESDESSGDSLAARVTSLLRKDAMVAVRAVSCAEEEERQARGSVKLKLTSHQVMPDTELSEEDRRRIDEIKRELLEGAKQKDYSQLHKMSSSEDIGGFRLQLTPSPSQQPITDSHDFVEDRKNINSSIKRDPLYGGMTKDVSDKPPTTGDFQQDLITEHHTQEAWTTNVSELDRQSLLLVKSSDEATKPISSITFSSRKRSSPPSTSDRGSPAVPSDLPVILDNSLNNEDFALQPPPVPTVSNNISHRYHADLAPAGKAADTTLVTSLPWRPKDSITQEFPAVDKEYSATSSIKGTSDPSPERLTTFSWPEKENRDPAHDNINSEVSSGRSHLVRTDGGKDRLRASGERKATGDGLVSVSTLESQTKAMTSSPTRKALSCIHVTISPKEDMKVLDVSKALVTLDSDNGLNVNTSANLSRNDPILSKNNLSAGPEAYSPILYPTGGKMSVLENKQYMDKENLADKSMQSDRRRSPLSDATTQITTESPQKTTFSAEIFVEGSLKEASTSSILKVPQTPERQMSPRTPLSCLSRATDQPLLLPYRPPGSPELFYVPVMEGGSRMSPVSTVESSHPGSNDAISPKFPLDVLGSAAGKLPDPSIPRHREGIYSKETSPKSAEQNLTQGWTDERRWSQHPSGPSLQNDQTEKDCRGFSKLSSSTVHARRPQRHQATSMEDNEFLPLQPEIDYSQDQSDLQHPARSRTLEVMKKKTYSSTTSDYAGQSHKSGHIHGKQSISPSTGQDRSIYRSPSVASNQSLDDLWVRYTETRRRRGTESSNKLEVSLVERLDRLARLLQNPLPYSLVSSKDEKPDQTHEKKSAREQWYSRKLEATQSVDEGSVGKPSEDSADICSLHSDLSEMRSTVTDSATTDSQAGTEVSSGTGSVSTIDTIRLIKAFGPERVIPSSRLSRLYSTIDLQKKRTEKAKASKRTSAGHRESRVEMQELQRTQVADGESLASSDLWEPSPALREKKSSRGVNKGIQAGELEIVMSATKRNTRDVGTTFPSPGDRLTTVAAPNMETRRTSKSKVSTASHPPGLSWFVPAEDLKSESRKENKPSFPRGPGLAWYEAMTTIKPWREPLREKNEQDPITGRLEDPNHRVRVPTSAQHKPFIRVTLQESLRCHRPDFIFRSGERMKRLQLLAEERKMQSVFQGERDELFNRAARGRDPQYTACRLLQQNRSVPKKEMIQRSKRIYQQLPEIRKRKEEEKRKTQYESNRLRAQLYRKKVTNHILGRKTPWT